MCCSHEIGQIIALDWQSLNKFYYPQGALQNSGEQCMLGKGGAAFTIPGLQCKVQECKVQEVVVILCYEKTQDFQGQLTDDLLIKTREYKTPQWNHYGRYVSLLVSLAFSK